MIEISNNDKLLILEALEILIEDIDNDLVDDSKTSQYRQKLVIKLDELYEKLTK